jgi:hypothetical protein
MPAGGGDGYRRSALNDKTYLQIVGARILSEANDLKRDLAILASEIGFSPDTLAEVVAGTESYEAADTVIRRMGETYPIDEQGLRLIRDDCDAGIKMMRAEESAASGRVFARPDRSGELAPYYEYRDTAFSRLSPFRPEWIRQLRLVHDLDPENPDVAFNQGHFLHQYSMYVGPVNHYWEIDGRRYAAEMNTGDSSYTTPFRPHTFTTRSATGQALILAVTFGGKVWRAQREMYALGDRVRHYIAPRDSRTATARFLIRQHLDNAAMTAERLCETLHAAGSEPAAEAFRDDSAELTAQDIRDIAGAIGVDERDLAAGRDDSEPDVLVKHYAPGDEYPYPSRDGPGYSVTQMVSTSRMPAMRGCRVKVTAASNDLRDGFVSGLHGWMYNYGPAAATLTWSDGVAERQAPLRPGDSAYIQPFVRCALSRAGREAAELCLVRVAGSIAEDTQRELSQFPSVTRAVCEDRRWY